jgi:hypothetical protein
VDVIGLGALVIAALGLVAAMLVVRTPTAEPSVAPSVPTAPAFAPPVRDQWYLESGGVRAAPPISSQARDRWYLDGRVAPDPPKDRWYRD